MTPKLPPGRQGRLRTRPQVQRLTVEIEAELFANLDQAARDFNTSYRAIIETALRFWLEQLYVNQREET